MLLRCCASFSSENNLNTQFRIMIFISYAYARILEERVVAATFQTSSFELSPRPTNRCKRTHQNKTTRSRNRCQQKQKQKQKNATTKKETKKFLFPVLGKNGCVSARDFFFFFSVGCHCFRHNSKQGGFAERFWHVLSLLLFFSFLLLLLLTFFFFCGKRRRIMFAWFLGTLGAFVLSLALLFSGNYVLALLPPLISLIYGFSVYSLNKRKLKHIEGLSQFVPHYSMVSRFIPQSLQKIKDGAGFQQAIEPFLAKNGLASYCSYRGASVFTRDADHVREVMQSSGGQFRKPTHLYQVLELFGPNIITASDGPQWKKHRSTCNPVLISFFFSFSLFCFLNLKKN